MIGEGRGQRFSFPSGPCLQKAGTYVDVGLLFRCGNVVVHGSDTAVLHAGSKLQSNRDSLERSDMVTRRRDEEGDVKLLR